MGGRTHAVVVACLLAFLGSPASAQAGNGGFAPVEPSSPGAERISDIYWFIAAFSLAILLAVVVPLGYFVVRYRGRGRPREVEGPQLRGNTTLELVWTAIPVLILVAIASFVFYKLPGITDPAGAAGDEILPVRVEGRQYYWQFEYPNDVIAVNTLRLPADRTTEFEITAPASDVIHSFWVPALAGKRDAIPGDTTSMKVHPTEPGTLDMVCGEFCGLQHARMVGEVEVLPAAEFDAWLDAQAAEQDAGESDLGEVTYAGACAPCHGEEGEGLIGPPLESNPIVNDAEQVADIVRNGRGQMPAIGEGWGDRQMEALTTYLRETYGPQTGGSDGG